MDSTPKATEKGMENATSLYAEFSKIPDPRRKRGIRYPLAVVLTLVTLGKLSGESHLQGIAEWGQLRAEALCHSLGLKRNRLPHPSTYSRILRHVDEQRVQQAIEKALGSDRIEEKQLILDGKTLRGTIALAHNRGKHLLSLYAPDKRTVVNQAEVGVKENEIVVAPQVLAGVSLSGKVITGDAMFTQRSGISVPSNSNNSLHLSFVSVFSGQGQFYVRRLSRI